MFGAFVAGIVLHQVPRVRKETVAPLESFTFGVLAPIFFGIVGLKVNLWALGGGGRCWRIVIGVACVGKLVGCTLGGIWGGLRFWEAVVDRRRDERARRDGDRRRDDRSVAGDPDARRCSRSSSWSRS